MNHAMKRMTAWMIVLVMCVLMIPMTATVLAATDTSTVPGWTFENWAEGGIMVDTTEKYSGQASVKLWNKIIGTDKYVRFSYPINVEPGHTYRYGFMAKVKNAEGSYAQMNWDRTRLGYLTPTGATADWRAFEFSYTNTSETTAYLRFVMEKMAGELWLDDLFFYDTAKPATAENNLIKNPSFEGIQSQAATSEASQDIIPVSKVTALTVDGKLDDWADIPGRTLDIYTDYGKVPQSVSGEIRYAYDDQNFYFSIDVEDDVHFYVPSGSYWNGDGLQFTICKTDETFGTAYGAVFDEKNNTTVEFGDTAIDAKTTREGTNTQYEVAIPWASYFGDMPEVALFCAIVNDNDNDAAGRKGCIDVAPGISMYKGSQLFPKLMFLKEGVEFAAFFQGQANVATGEVANYTVDMVNQTMNKKSLTITSEAANVKETVTLDAGASASYKFSMKQTGYGDKIVDVTVTDGKKEYKATAETNVMADAAMTEQAIKKQKGYLEELTALKAKCEAKDIPIEYQKVMYNTIKMFIEYMEEDLTDNDLERIAETDRVLTNLYTQAKADFEGYLDGTKEPVSVPQYVTSPITWDGTHFVATTEREDGTREERPVFFVGSGHWAATRNREQVEAISSVGFNCMHPEIGPWDAMSEAIAVKDWLLKGVGTYEITVSASKDVKKNGQSALKIVSNQPKASNNYKYLIQTVDVKPNTTYEYGVSVKSDNVKEAFYMITTNGLTGIGNKAMRQYVSGTFDWRDDALTYTTGPTEKNLYFIILIEDTAGAIYMDDAYIRQKGTDKNLLLNGNFEGTYPADKYYAMDERVVNELVDTFAACDEFNVSGQFALAPHYVPSFLLRDYPEIELPKQWGNFNHQDPNHPALLEMYEVFYKSLLPRVKDFESFDGIVVCNEPQYNSMLDSWAFIDDFREAMEKKYGTIEALNARWGTTHHGFDEIEIPTVVDTSPKFYDWREYNDTILPNWVEKLVNIVKSVDPDVFAHVKIMDVLKTGVNFRIQSSNNYEIMKDYTDISGCDAWSMIATDDVRWKNVFYDFMTSIKDAPIYNTEDHIIVDARQLAYNDRETLYNVVDIWNGAVHGRGGSVLWIWDRSSRTKNGTIYFNSLLTARPETIATLGKTTLDLNRLSKEVVALQESKADIAIMYTPNSAVYTEEMLDIIRKTSASLGENGQKTRFVVESQMEKLKDYKALIVPNTISLKKETLDAIKDFVANGGKVLVIGEKALTVSEYGDPHDPATISYIKDNATCIDFEDAGTIISGKSVKDIKAEVDKLVEELNLDAVKVIDKATGETILEADWITAEYEDSYIINLCSYTWEDREVEVQINGKTVEASEDLINFGKYDSTIKLEGHVPLLLKISK